MTYICGRMCHYLLSGVMKQNSFIVYGLSLVPRPFEEEEKGPGTHRLRMRHVFRKTHRKIIRKFTAYTWIKILTSEAE